MARTYRDTLNHQRRAKRRSWDPANYIPGEDFDFSDPINRYPRLRGGNMVMAESRCGIWGDERFRSGADRDAQRRAAKRVERNRWRREVERELLSDPHDDFDVEAVDALEGEWAAWIEADLERWFHEDPFELDYLAGHFLDGDDFWL